MTQLFWNTTNVEGALEAKWGEYHRLNSNEWINFLLKNVKTKIIKKIDEINPDENLIIIDSSIEKKFNFYSKLNLLTSKIFLFHLGDEAGAKEARSVYSICEYSWKTFCNNYYFSNKKVSCIPLGYKSGVAINLKKNEIKEENKWAFIGTAHKSSRHDLLYQLSKIKPNFVHTTLKFNDVKSINSKEMSEALSNTVFLPCPSGFIHPETYRLYEALECHCIPIVEDSYKYYDRLFPKNPFLKITKWIEAKDIILKMDESMIKNKKKECEEWWQNYKLELQKSITKKITNNA